MDTSTFFFVAFGGLVVVMIGAPICRLVSMLNRSETVQAAYHATRMAREIEIDHYEVAIYPDGRELFLPPAGRDNPVYELTFHGVIGREVSILDDPSCADLLYRTNSKGNFTYSHDWLRIKGCTLGTAGGRLIEADRALHIYRIRVDGGAERLTIAFEPPNWYRCKSGTFLIAHIRLLPDETLTFAAKRRESETQAAADKLRLEQHRKNSAVAERFSKHIAALAVRAEVLRNWGDPEFQRRFAEMNRDELLRRQNEIRSATIQLLDQHELVQYLKRHNPEVLRRFLGEFEALLIAEDLQTRKAVPPPPRRRQSIEDFRKRLCQRIEVAGEDRKALFATVLEQKQRMIEKLDEFDLSDDEREDYLKEIEDWAAGERVRADEGRVENADSKTI